MEAIDTTDRFSKGKPGQPVFIDYVIRIMLCRVYVNVQDRKLLTAEKILGNVDQLIKLIKEGKTLEIVKHPDIREDNGCNYYDLELLEKKYWLMRGILY